jgi:hypothetical protein
MKFRNGWKARTKQWDKFAFRFRLGFLDVMTIEVDISRDFYLLTIFNLTVKNR